MVAISGQPAQSVKLAVLGAAGAAGTAVAGRAAISPSPAKIAIRPSSFIPAAWSK
jgi:hypothetical protein